MRNLILMAAMACLTLGGYAGEKKPIRVFATCKGESPCKACSNCKYCKHCAKNGKTCGICKK